MKITFYNNKIPHLICIDEGSDSIFWDKHWESKMNANPKETSKWFVDVTSKYLPKGASIIEGGCGLGDKVWGLDAAGYEVIGVDFAEKTVNRIKNQYPHLDVRLEDVRNLQIESSSVDGYWSLGVIEHFWDGYGDVLNEMFRVLRPGGYLFLSFPSISPLRRFKIKIGLYPNINIDTKHIDFYQYILDHRDVIYNLNHVGFDIIECYRKVPMKGLEDECAFAAKIIKLFNSAFIKLTKRKKVDIITTLSPGIINNSDRNPQTPRHVFIYLYLLLTKFCGHSSMIVAQKKHI